MPKRKIQRTPEEEEEFQRIKREKKAAYQRKYRERIKNDKNIRLQNSKNLCQNFQVENNDFINLSNEKTNTNNVVLEYEESINLPSTSNNNDNITQNIEEHFIGPMDVLCVHCNAYHFAAEKVAHKKNSFSDCCSHGEVFLEPLPEPPEILRDLFNGKHENSRDFLERIRCYNNSFAFASFNANLVNFNLNNRRPGPYCFKIHGQVYYQINTSLYPSADENPSYGQLFIIDQNEATDIRCNQISTLRTDIVEAIDNALRNCNVFAQSYRMMHEELQQAKINAGTETEPEMQLLFSLKPGIDTRRYNLQKINEVAAIFTTTADGDIPESYVSIRNKQTKSLQYVSSMDPNVEPWLYPLFYSHGTKGWNDKMQCVNKSKRVSRSGYIKYRMATRDNNVFLRGGRLFQQWIVDSYVKMEKDRMNYCRINQKKLRADTYQGLIDHLHKRADETNSHVGKLVILPSSFTGSPRNMLQYYQDAMAIVRKFGKPDLFITMTCNPNWREIQENLLQDQTASDRPEIVSRVFKLKNNELIRIIVEEKLFGEVLAYVYVVEYQKRGLPHVHLLLTLKQNSKITIPEVVDKHISSEIPNPDENLQLHNIVMKHMIHGPCGDWCKDDKGKCSKKYPKHFQVETTMDENGYPTYRRRNTGVYSRSNGNTTDNQYVVPYNSTLLQLFNCHINVEAVSSIKSVKYLYKYIYKGHDAAAVTVTDPVTNENVIEHDEIHNFIETRYVGPVEASDRIFGRPLQNKSHSIIRLPVHLPNQQTVTIDEEADPESIRTALEKDSMLIDYFALNQRDPYATQFTYSEIPEHYVFKKQKNVSNTYKWENRKAQFKIIGRMHAISPTQIELFHLRLLLITVKGATSFENIKTVNDQRYNTFHAACLALGLIEDDAEWNRAMAEGEIWMMPPQLRRLFVRILLYCHPNNPEDLWEEFKDAMSQDFQRNCEISGAFKRAYQEINILLSNERSGLSYFPTMVQISEFEACSDHLTDDEVSPQQHEEIGQIQYNKLNEKQKDIVDIVLDNVMASNETVHPVSCFYIDGPGGSGKTFIYTTLYHLLKGKKKIICSMAFTGIAAILLPHGKTVHKTFGMPVPIFSDSVSHIKSQSKDAQYLREVDVFIWDEAPMAPRYALELVDRTLRDFTNINLPFGGKMMILGGDFRQLLPVKVNATRSELINLSIKFSSQWKHFRVFTLTENMRTLPGETEFAKYLLSVGDGILNDNNNNLIVPEQCVANKNDDIVEEIFKTLINERHYEDLAKVAILSARNVDVEEINTRVVELFEKTTERIYTSVDSVDNCDNGDINDDILTEYLNTLNPPNLPPYALRLRNNCVVMLIRNLSINEGLCNGTRLQILELSNNLLRCRILTGDKTDDIVFIHRITLYCEDIYPFTFKRRQFPIKLAFAMTINKSQGQTFDKIGIDLRKDVFNHGQLYVAFSRVRSWNSLRIFMGNQRKNNIVKNYVYKELYV